jgi:hypothetical protein
MKRTDKFQIKNVFILNEFRMISHFIKTEIEIESFSISKQISFLYELLKTFSIEKFVNFKFENLPSHLDISKQILFKFQVHLTKYLEKHTISGVYEDEKFCHLSINNEEGETFKIYFLFGQNMNSIQNFEKT